MARPFKPCAVDGCNGNAHHSARGSRGYCLKHYRKWQKYGDATAGREYAPRSTCAVEGCDAFARTRGWCPLHYKRWKRNGDPEKRVVGENKPGQKCSVEWCEKDSKKRGLCETHYAFLRTNPGKGASDVELVVSSRDWIEAHKSWSKGGCLIWPFYRMPSGYGYGRWMGHSGLASRMMCIAAHGEPPTPKHEAAHSCGKGHEGCVNPKHLYWATSAENKADRVRHGTSNRGARHGMSKLSPVDVIGIRLMLNTSSQRKIAGEFGVSQSAVWHISVGSTWGHLFCE